MKLKYYLFISMATGIICGYASVHYLLIGWGNIIFWGLVGVALGLIKAEKKTAIWCGLAYGYFLSMSFLLNGFAGGRDKLVSFILFSLALSLAGALGGLVSFLAGRWLKKTFA